LPRAPDASALANLPRVSTVAALVGMGFPETARKS
jgi:hypothetical protein